MKQTSQQLVCESNVGLRWNRLDQPATSFGTGLLFCLSFALFVPHFVLAIPVTSGPNGTLGPPVPGDSQDYDNIGLNLARGRGFGVYHDDPEWRAPYEANNQHGMYDEILTRHGGYRPTAYRPPGYPFLLSIVYRSVGRSFFAARLANACLLSLAVSITVLLAARYVSISGACVVMMIGLADGVLRSYAGAYMTEALAVCALAVTLWAMLAALQTPNVWRMLLAGVCFGLLILSRSLFVFWTPLLVVLVGYCMQLSTSDKLLRRVGLASLFLVGALLVLLPWWARNCMVLQAFMPLGTQGGHALAAAYSDEIIENDGHWTAAPTQRILAENPLVHEALGDSILQEREECQFVKAHAMQWLKTNYWKLPQLATIKLVAHWLPGYDFFGCLLRVLVVIGCLTGIRSMVVRFCLGLLVIDSLSIAATYEDFHRFIVAVYPILYLLAAIGALRFARWSGDLLARQAGDAESHQPPYSY